MSLPKSPEEIPLKIGTVNSEQIQTDGFESIQESRIQSSPNRR